MQLIRNNKQLIYESSTAKSVTELIKEAIKNYMPLDGANLRYTKLEPIDFSGHNLTDVDFEGAVLRGCNFTDTTLRGVNFTLADLSGATGFITTREYLEKYGFKTTRSGIHVFKGFGNTEYTKPDRWEIKRNSIITETVNPCRATACGCGVNFANRSWVGINYPRSAIWECLIEWPDAGDIVVPFNTDGKARCSRLKLLKRVN